MRIKTLTVTALLALCVAAEDPKVAHAKADLATLRTALDTYEIDTGAYPTTAQGLAELAKKGGHGPYIDKLPKDPWGHDYVYRCPGTGKADFDLLSYGPDGKPGGGDDVESK